MAIDSSVSDATVLLLYFCSGSARFSYVQVEPAYAVTSIELLGAQLDTLGQSEKSGCCQCSVRLYMQTSFLKLRKSPVECRLPVCEWTGHSFSKISQAGPERSSSKKATTSLSSKPYAVRGPNRMMAAPARQIAAPMKSHRSGRCPSMIQSHNRDEAM